MFSDITGSVVLGESLDPEALQEILRDYFTAMSRILTRHGAIIEKFIGDAIMAVFGLEITHEDDALRTARAALEMQAARDELNSHFREHWGIELQVRTGIHTGEVVVGDPDVGQPFAVGDVMNVAARLQQIAEPGQILMSPATYEEVSRQVEAEDLGPRTLKGKSEPIRAYSLLGLGADAFQRRTLAPTPLVGRASELERLRRAYDQAVSTRSFVMMMVVGDAGIGKTRLSRELAETIGDSARVLWGQASSYDRSNTLAPIVQVIKQAAGTTDGDDEGDHTERLGVLLGEGNPLTDALDVLIGVSDESVHERDMFFAVRRALESLAQERPVIVILDDLHWTNPKFLDLVGYLAGWGSDAPVLIVCLSRPEILEGDAKPLSLADDSILRLHPLDQRETEELLRRAGGTSADRSLVERIVRITGGNPLFIEETVGILDDPRRGEEEIDDFTKVPDSIRALIRARVDSVRDEELATLQRAAAIGHIFWWRAVTYLCDDTLRDQIDHLLRGLMRRALIQPSRSQLEMEDAFIFSNALLREVVYDGTPKMSRSRFHQAMARWLVERTAAGEVTVDDIIGFHLEQSLRLLKQVGVKGSELQTVGRAAETHLRAAGLRALSRWDFPAAASLLGRALDAAASAESVRWETAVDAAEAMIEVGDLVNAKQAVETARATATEAKDPAGLAHADILASSLQIRSDNPAGWGDAARLRIREALATFEEVGDPTGSLRAHELLGDVYFYNGLYGRGEKELRAAAIYAKQAGARRAEVRILTYRAAVLMWGPTPVSEALPGCEQILERMSDSRWGRAKVLLVLGGLHAMDGDFARAERETEEAKELMHELGMTSSLATGRQVSSLAYALAGNDEQAIRELRLGYEECERTKNLGFLGTAATYLARALIASGKAKEAGHFLSRAKAVAPEDDDVAHAEIDLVEALLLAHERRAEAIDLSEAALRVFERTDELNDHADALLCHATILADLDRDEDSRRAARASANLYRKKGVKPSLERALAMSGDR